MWSGEYFHNGLEISCFPIISYLNRDQLIHLVNIVYIKSQTIYRTMCGWVCAWHVCVCRAYIDFRGKFMSRDKLVSSMRGNM